jgi:hypothetical protein
MKYWTFDFNNTILNKKTLILNKNLNFRETFVL